MNEQPSVRNELSGHVWGHVVQAGAIHGNVVLPPSGESIREQERVRQVRKFRRRWVFGGAWFLMGVLGVASWYAIPMPGMLHGVLTAVLVTFVGLPLGLLVIVVSWVALRITTRR